jgi:RNA polymerase sigma-70 factor (ECF subfamily)
VVLEAGDDRNPEAEEALEVLCGAYWYPLYAYTRRQGYDAPAAADLTQAFFARFLEKEYLKSVDPEKGRFRAFLLACMRHFLSNERDRERALKRGGGRAPLSLDGASAEARYRNEPAHELTAERIYHRRWALTLLEQVLDRLREDYARRHRAALFEALEPTITGGGGQSYRETGAALGLSEGAVKVAVHRLRRRYAETLRQEIGRTVGSPREIDEELQCLLDALGETSPLD